MHTRTISQGVFVFDKGDRREQKQRDERGVAPKRMDRIEGT
jgi:hypothetical protein